MAKTWITNNHSENLEFNLTAGGQEVVAAGETKSVDLADRDSAQNRAYVHAGLVTFADKKPEEAKSGTGEAPAKAAGSSGAIGGGQP